MTSPTPEAIKGLIDTIVQGRSVDIKSDLIELEAMAAIIEAIFEQELKKCNYYFVGLRPPNAAFGLSPSSE